MRKFIAIPLLMLALTGAAQQLENKLNIYFGYTSGSFGGNKTTSEGSFTYPSLYGNVGSTSGYAIKGLYRLKPYVSLGIGLEKVESAKWQSTTYSDYNDAKVTQLALHPTLQLHTLQAKAGVLNWVKAYLEVEPGIGSSKVTFSKPIFDVVSNKEAAAQPSETTNTFYGVRGSAGVEIAPTRSFGIFASYSYGFARVSSDFYADHHFTATQLTVGLFLKFMKNKHAIYE